MAKEVEGGEKEEGLKGITYETSGVSIRAQNEVNARIKEELQALGLKAEGLFGGAVDITHLKEKKTVPIGVVCSSIVEGEDASDAGLNTAEAALEKIEGRTESLAMLDYYASPKMDESVPAFVRGVATAGLTQTGVPTIGGESAQMPGTYNEGKMDAYVDVVYHGTQGTTVDIADLIRGMERPLLCASTDGTGTKTRIVKDPRDIIYHGLNDLGAIGVRQAAFKLYVAGNVKREELEEVVAKSRQICDTLGITALDPTIEIKPEEYAPGQVDIAGTVIGVIDEKDMITGENVEEGDAIIGIATDCLMTNGYSLARRYVEKMGHQQDDENLPGLEGTTIRKELSKPHVPYTDVLFGNKEAEGILSKFKGKIKATAHITGGGQKDNMERMVPNNLCAVVGKEVLPLLPIVEYFAANGADMDEMYRTFNMGVGFTVTVSADIADEVIKYLNENFKDSAPGVERTAAKIGRVMKSEAGEKFKWAA